MIYINLVIEILKYSSNYIIICVMAKVRISDKPRIYRLTLSSQFFYHEFILTDGCHQFALQF